MKNETHRHYCTCGKKSHFDCTCRAPDFPVDCPQCEDKDVARSVKELARNVTAFL
jgi:hypothetical protein